MKRTFSLTMTLSQAIKLLGYTAIYSVVKEMIQLRRTSAMGRGIDSSN